MINLSDYAKTLEHKPVAVFGLGLSGLSVVKALVAANIRVTAWDDNPDNCAKAREFGAECQDLTQIDLKEYAFLLLAPGVPYSFEPHPVVINAQKYQVEIIGDLELLHRSNHRVKTVGITGTNGKSTTTALMTHVLNECGINAVMGGNIGKPVFDLDLSNIEILVLEISSYQMDLCPSFRPNISIILNITPDHLDRHGSMDSYIAAKAKILEGKGLAIIGVDDDFTQVLFDQTFLAQERKVIPISVQLPIPEGLFVRNDVLYRNIKGEDIKIASLLGYESLKGVHNYQNISCVYAAIRDLDIKDDIFFKSLGTYPGLPHRQYLVTRSNKVSYINDSKATNAEAAAKALSSYDGVYWIIGGQPKKAGLQGLEIFKDRIVKTYVIGEASQSFHEWLIYHGFAHELCDTLEVATQKAHEEAQGSNKNSVVLLSPACASWDQFKSFEKRGDAFSDQVLDLVKGAQ